MAGKFFDMHIPYDPFSIDIEQTGPKKFVNLDSYQIIGHNEKGVGYVFTCDSTGTRIEYHKPADWTAAEWDAFCDEMESEYEPDPADE